MNSLKIELMGVRAFKTEEELYAGIEHFACVYYNHERSNSANGGLTPFEAKWRQEAKTSEPDGPASAGFGTNGNEEETDGTPYHSVSDEQQKDYHWDKALQLCLTRAKTHIEMNQGQ